MLARTTTQRSDLIRMHRRALSEERLERVLAGLDRLRPDNVEISFFNVNGKSYGEVAEIFERINLGTPVRKSQIMLGKLSARFHGVVETVEGFLEKHRVRHGCRLDLDLFMTTFTAIVVDRVDVSSLENRYLQEEPTEARVKRDISRTSKALLDALRFLEDELRFDTLRYFNSPRTVTCLAYLCSKAGSHLKAERDRKAVALWAMRSLLSYHHADQGRLYKDICTIRDNKGAVGERLLKAIDRREVQAWIDTLKDEDHPIGRASPMFGCLYALLRWNEAPSFMNKRFLIHTDVAVDDDDEEEECYSVARARSLEIHHIYPVARLREENGTNGNTAGRSTSEWTHDIGNLTFLTGIDNLTLGDPDIEYLRGIDEDIRNRHLIPCRAYRKGQYERLLMDRRKLIRKGLNELLQSLSAAAGVR